MGDSRPKNPAPHLLELKDKLYRLAQDIEFHKSNMNPSDPIQKKMKEDLEKIRSDVHVCIAADKTQNRYMVGVDDYNGLLEKEIHKDYKKGSKEMLVKATETQAKAANELQIGDKLNITAKSDAYVTIKDHKNGFPNNVKTRLINPAKPDLGKVAKVMVQEINEGVRNKTGLGQVRKTSEIINWFKDLDNDVRSFTVFDVTSFYPNITEELVTKALNWASSHVTISQQDMKTIMAACESFLFCKNEIWTKKDGKCKCDITMGSFCGAEIAELVGLFLLSELEKNEILAKLYRDDGIYATKKPPKAAHLEAEKIKDIFKKHGLSLELEDNQQKVNFLDVHLNLIDRTFEPFMKPNFKPLYVHTRSNHPPKVIEAIPKGVNYRLSNISCNVEKFDKVKPVFQKALDDAGHKFELNFNPNPKIW